MSVAPENETSSPVVKKIDTSQGVHKADIDELVASDGIDKAIDAISGMKVVELRTLVREYDDFPMTGRELVKANKAAILSSIGAYYKK